MTLSFFFEKWQYHLEPKKRKEGEKYNILMDPEIPNQWTLNGLWTIPSVRNYKSFQKYWRVKPSQSLTKIIEKKYKDLWHQIGAL